MKIETTFAPNHGNLARHVRTLGRRGLRPEVCILRLLQFVGAPLAAPSDDRELKPGPGTCAE